MKDKDEVTLPASGSPWVPFDTYRKVARECTELHARVETLRVTLIASTVAIAILLACFLAIATQVKP